MTAKEIIASAIGEWFDADALISILDDNGYIIVPKDPGIWEFICEVPKELGAVTKLETKYGRTIAHTESGRTMIVPIKPKSE